MLTAKVPVVFRVRTDAVRKSDEGDRKQIDNDVHASGGYEQSRIVRTGTCREQPVLKQILLLRRFLTSAEGDRTFSARIGCQSSAGLKEKSAGGSSGFSLWYLSMYAKTESP